MLLHGPPGEALNTLRRPRRGLKIHAVLQYYVCTSGQHLPHSKGGNAVRFAGRRGHVPVITASSPFKRGRCCPFFFFLATGGTCPLPQHLSPFKRGRCCPFFFLFWPPGAHTRYHSIFPHSKGGDAIRFYAPPPREVQCFFFFFRPLVLCSSASGPL